MKNKLAVLAAGLFFMAACNDSTEEKAMTNDTANTTSTATTGQKSPNQDTARQSADVMKPMNDMMERMQSMQMTGDFDVDFANMMVEHHQGALDMSQIEVSHGKNEKVKAKAQEIIAKQQKEQQDLKNFVASYKPSGMKHGEGELQKSMTKAMDKAKAMKMTGDVDKDFVEMMILHHQHGIEMSKMEIKNGMSAKLKQMTKKGIASQEKDIKELQSLE